MTATEYTRAAKDGTELHLFEWKPAGPARSVVCLVHGLGDHSGCFKPLTEFLVEHSFAVLAVDYHGNGKSGGARGDIPSYETFMEDIDLLLGEAAARFPGQSPFLYGHSLGGNLVLNYVLRRNPSLSGCIATSPWLALAGGQTGTIIGARLLRLVQPGRTIDAGIHPEGLSHDPVFRATYASDPLVHGMITVRLLAVASSAAAWARRHARKLRVPTLVMHSPKDVLTSFEASRNFARAAGSDVCRFKEWSDSFHSLHNEVNKDEVFAYVLGWIEEIGPRRIR